MKKIAICSLLLALGIVEASFAGKCTLTTCTPGGDKGKYGNLLRANDGRVGFEFPQGSCYRCNWGGKEECDDGTVIAIKHPRYTLTKEIKGFYKCSDEGEADDDWVDLRPGDPCDYNNMLDEIKEFAKKSGKEDKYLIVPGDHTTSHYILYGGTKSGTEKDNTGDTLVLSSGSIGCKVYLCENGYTPNADHIECIKDGQSAQQPGGGAGGVNNTVIINNNVQGGGQQGGQQSGFDCTTPGNELATKTISGVTACSGGACLVIEAGQCYPYKYLRCMEAIAEGKETKITWNTTECVCTDDKKEFDYDARKCVSKNAKRTCEEIHPNGSPERLACCRAGSATRWNGSETSGTCTCNNGTKWLYTAGDRTGQCVAQEQPVQPVQPVVPTTQQCWYSFSADVKCANGAMISKTSGFNVNTQMSSCEEFTALYHSDQSYIMEMAEKYCRQHPELPVIDDKAFNAAKDSINAFFGSAKSSASVWKNSEGKFNTARLASDLTAGVVLGTVGGVVSGVVIKKKQIEKGFEALHCTVGGQKVADWGDEFNIGLRR